MHSMSNNSDYAKIEIILELILDMNLIIQRHGGIPESLLDIEGKHALLMCLQQIGENLGKVENEEWQLPLETKVAKIMRNIIAHDYLGIKLSIIQNTIEISIPKLKIKITEILSKRSPS